jgi:hypothetical protein
MIYLQVGGAFIMCSRPNLQLGELKISTQKINATAKRGLWLLDKAK